MQQTSYKKIVEECSFSDPSKIRRLRRDQRRQDLKSAL